MADQSSSLLESQVACSCGVAGCRELAWPHEWDPIAAGDTCVIDPGPHLTISYLGAPPAPPHPVTMPFVRWGSGYACAACAEALAP